MKKKDFMFDLYFYLVENSDFEPEPIESEMKNSIIWLKYEDGNEFFIKVRFLSKKKKIRITLEDKVGSLLMFREYPCENLVEKDVINISIDIEEQLMFYFKNFENFNKMKYQYNETFQDFEERMAEDGCDYEEYFG